MAFWTSSCFFSAAGRLPRDGDPVVADSGLEHRDTAVQPGSVPRGWEVVRPRHELHPPPWIPAGELWDTGTELMEGKEGETESSCNYKPLRSFEVIPLFTHRCLDSTVKSWTGWTKPRRTSSWKNDSTETLTSCSKHSVCCSLMFLT